MADFIPASLVYKQFGLPRSAINSLAQRGIVRCETREIDVCHTMKFFSVADIEKYLEQGGAE